MTRDEEYAIKGALADAAIRGILKTGNKELSGWELPEFSVNPKASVLGHDATFTVQSPEDEGYFLVTVTRVSGPNARNRRR